MKVLLINKFLYPKGGDAISTLNTGKLLQQKGYEVSYWGMEHHENPDYPYKNYFIQNVDYAKTKNLLNQIKIFSNILYSFEAKNKIEKLIKKLNPDIIHLHNFAHQISPSIIDVFSKLRIPMVMTLHDYKLVCGSYLLVANGKVCEACNHNKHYHCFLKKCVKNSYAKSLITTLEMYLHHKILNIYDEIKVLISPSIFLKNKLIEMGSDNTIKYLPNFIDTNRFNPEYKSQENSIVYLGRLSSEKGLFTLLRSIKGVDTTLKIIGEGPISDNLKSEANKLKLNNVMFLGFKTGDELLDEIRKTKFLILPSECYENNPTSVLEGFALGKPVIGARIGGIPELVIDNKTGMTFESGNVEDLRNKIEKMLKNKENISQMGFNARKKVENQFNAESYYNNLINIYDSVIK